MRTSWNNIESWQKQLTRTNLVLTFPKRSFGNKTVVRRSFQPSWFDSFSWLHYDESRDVAYCYVCMRASKEKKLAAKCTDQAFISRGFHNWKAATVSFRTLDATRMPFR